MKTIEQSVRETAEQIVMAATGPECLGPGTSLLSMLVALKGMLSLPQFAGTSYLGSLVNAVNKVEYAMWQAASTVDKEMKAEPVGKVQ